MAKRPKSATEIEVVEGEVIDQQRADPADELISQLQAAGDGAEVVLKRVGTDGRLAYLPGGTLNKSVFSLERVAQLFGGGEYHGQVRKEGGTWGHRVRFHIDGPPRAVIIDAPPQAPAGQPWQPPRPDPLAELADRFTSSLNDLQKTIAGLAHERVQELHPRNLAVELAELKGELRAATANAGKVTLQEAAALTGKGASMAELMELLEMARRFNGGKTTESAQPSMIERFAPMLMALVAGDGKPAAPQLTPPAGTPTKPAAADVEIPEMFAAAFADRPDDLKRVRRAVAIVRDGIKSGKCADQVAPTVALALGRNLTADLLDLGELIEPAMAEAVAKVGGTESFSRELIERVRAIFTAPPAEAATTGGA